MATVAKLEALLEAHTSSFDHAMDRSHSKMGKVGKMALGAGIAIAGGLVVGMEKSVHAAIDAEASQARLAQSFANVHLSLKTYAGALDEAEASGRKLGFTDSQVRDALGSLLPATKNYAAAVKDLGVAQDLARFKHIELQDATKMLTMAMTGSQRAAKQLGISVSPVTKHMDALAKGATHAQKAHARLLDKMATGKAVIAATSALVAGQGDAFAGTAAGGMKIFHAQIEHLQETIGKKLLPALTKVLTKISAFISYLGAHPTVAKALAIGIAAVAVAMFTLAIATAAFNIAAAPEILVIGAIVLAIAALAAGLIYAWQRSETFRNVVTGVFHGIKAVVSTVVNYIKDHWRLMLGVLTGGLLPAIVFVTQHFNSIKGVVLTVVGYIKSVWDKIHDYIVNPARSAFNWVASHAGGMLKAFQDVIDKVVALYNWLKKLVKTAWNIVVHLHMPHVPGPSGVDLAKKLWGLRAAGGPVTGGGSYVVGEQGPEMFVPGSSGNIVPNHALGGTAVVHEHHYHAPVFQDEKFLDYLRALDRRFQTKNGRPAFGAGQ